MVSRPNGIAVLGAAALAAMLAGATGCAEEATCPDTADAMIFSEAGLVVTESEHEIGWGHEECATCHPFAALHRQGCSPDVDLAKIREEVREEGEAACRECHGDNGVDEDEE